LTDTLAGGAQRGPDEGSRGSYSEATSGAAPVAPASGFSARSGPSPQGKPSSPGIDIQFGADPVATSSVGMLSPSEAKPASQVDPRKMMVATSQIMGGGPNALAAMAGGGYWGWCDTEVVKPNLHVEKAGTEYKVKTVDFFGQYSKIVTLVPGVKEAGAPSAANYMKMAKDLDSLGDGPDLEWYMLKAVDAHESVHESRLKPALAAVEATLAAKFTPLKVAESATINSEATAEAAIKAQPAYVTAVGECRDIWDAKYVTLITGDHNVLTPAAEHAVVDPKIKSINEWAKAQTPALPEYV